MQKKVTIYYMLFHYVWNFFYANVWDMHPAQYIYFYSKEIRRYQCGENLSHSQTTLEKYTNDERDSLKERVNLPYLKLFCDFVLCMQTRRALGTLQGIYQIIYGSVVKDLVYK